MGVMPSETEEIESAEALQGKPWIGWLPILVLPLTTVVCRNLLPPWAFMWLLSFTIFISLKWLTWWRVRARVVHSAGARPPIFWLGREMGAKAFLDVRQRYHTARWANRS